MGVARHADTTRCVVAGRLANLDHNLQVMLIEAGESNLNVSRHLPL